MSKPSPIVWRVNGGHLCSRACEAAGHPHANAEPTKAPCECGNPSGWTYRDDMWRSVQAPARCADCLGLMT